MKHDITTILIGILFLVAGVAIGGNMLGYFNFTINFAGWWTLFIIIPAIIAIAQGGINAGNIILLSVGVILLLRAQGILPANFSWRLILPLILLIVGAQLLFGKTGNGSGMFCRSRKNNDDAKKENHSDSSWKKASVIFGEQNIQYGHEDFTGASYSVLFGSCKVNLRNVNLVGDVVITTSAMFGGIDIVLPDNVCVISHITPILGGTDCKYVSSRDPLAPKIIINGSAMFGGITIK